MQYVIINRELINKNMILYAVEIEGLCYVMLENFSGLGVDGSLLYVDDRTFTEVTNDTGFVIVEGVNDLLVNYNRIKKVTSSQIYFDNGFFVAHTDTESNISDKVEAIINPPAKTYYIQLNTQFDSTDNTRKDVTGLTFPVVSGKRYDVEIHAKILSSVTTMGACYGFRMPTGSASVYGFLEMGITSAVAATQVTAPFRDIGSSANLAGSFVTSTGVSNIGHWHNINGRLFLECTSTGTVVVTFGNETTGVATVNLGVGSFLKVNEIN